MYVKVELALDICTVTCVVLLRLGVVFFFLKDHVADLWQPLFAMCIVLSVTCPRIIRFAVCP